MPTVYGELRENTDHTTPSKSPNYVTTTTNWDVVVTEASNCGDVHLEYKVGTLPWAKASVWPNDRQTSINNIEVPSVVGLNLPVGATVRVCSYVKHGGYVRYMLVY